MKTRFYAAKAAAVLVLLAAACSSDSDSESGTPTSAAEAVTTAIAPAPTETPPSEPSGNAMEAKSLPPTPAAETTTTASSTSTTSTTTSTATTPAAAPAPTEEPGTSEPTGTTSSTTTAAPSAATSTTTTTSSTTTATTAAVAESPATLQVRVLNGSGVAGAAGRLTDKLSQAGYVVLSPANAPQRYSTSAVYYQEGWQEQAEEILQAAEIDEIDAPTAMPQQFATEEASVIVLLGTDTAPAVAREQAGLRPRQRNDVQLPLPASTPRDRYVPGLADINIYSQINDQGSLELQAKLEELSIYLRYIGNYQPYVGAVSANRDTAGTFREAAKLLEDTLLWMGFTPQNVCGAPAGYSFTDLLQPTREWSEELKVYSGDAIFTTDRLLELHGGERINPEANLDFYIQEAVQTAYDSLRLFELLDETEAPQMILCRAWKMPSGEIPEGANAYWYALLTPGIQPRESLLSQGTYHVKEISRNGNFAFLIVCHPTIGERYVRLWWREGGYRAEVTGELQNNGCQATFEIETYREDTYGEEDIFVFSFGERVFSSGDLLGFPRS